MGEHSFEKAFHLHEKIKSLRWAILLSFLLSVLKGAAGVFCSSAALVASALDSFMDVGISSVNYLSVKMASQPPDRDHAYGHEKIESLASYTQGVIFLLFSFFIFWKSIEHAQSEDVLTHSSLALIVIGVSALINFVITLMIYLTERKTHSLIMKAERAHYLMDILSYVMIFVSIVLVRLTGSTGWDILGGIMIAGYVAYLAVKILIQSGNELVDRSLPKRSLDELDHLIRAHSPHVLDYHELRTRKVGEKIFIDFHLVLEGEQSFENVHDITESLIQKIQFNFLNADVTIHEDPEHGE